MKAHCLFGSLIIITATIAFSFPATSQVKIEVENVKESISKGEQAGYKIAIPQATLDDVKKAWIKLIQQNTKSKAVEAGEEISIIGAVALQISPNPLGIYSVIRTVDSIVAVTAFFEIDSIFFDPATYSDPTMKDKIDKEIQAYIRKFGVEQYKVAVQDELKAEEDTLKNLNKQLSDLQKDKEKMENSIEDEEKNISEAESEINVLEATKSEQSKAVDAKRISSATILDKDAQKAAKDEIKALEKERDKTDKQLEKQQNSKKDSEKKIKDYEKAIEENVEQQGVMEVQITDQEAVVEKVESKLKGIK